MEARRQAQGQQFTEKLEAAKWEDMARTEAVEQALREQGDALRGAIEIGDRTNKVRLEELRGEVKGLEDKLRTFIVEAQMEESGRTHALLQEAQEQVVTALTSDMPVSSKLALNYRCAGGIVHTPIEINEAMVDVTCYNHYNPQGLLGIVRRY